VPSKYSEQAIFSHSFFGEKVGIVRNKIRYLNDIGKHQFFVGTAGAVFTKLYVLPNYDGPISSTVTLTLP